MIDSHSHIYMPRYDDDRQAVIERAAAAGITQLLQVGCSLEETATVLALSERVPGIYAAIGVHPHLALSVDTETLDRLAALTQHPKVVAWGEIGLDFYYNNSPHEVQQAAFAAQLQRAIRCEMPVVIHTREAEPETLDLLRRYPVPRHGQVHCFTGTPDMAEQLLEMGFYIGFTGIVSFNKAENVRAALRVVPLDRLLIETDSPYLAPTPQRGKRNEPAFVVHVAEAIARTLAISITEVVQHSTQNFYRLYGRDDLAWEPLTPVRAASA